MSLRRARQSTKPAARERPAPAKTATSPEPRAWAYRLMKRDCSVVGVQATSATPETAERSPQASFRIFTASSTQAARLFLICSYTLVLIEYGGSYAFTMD